MTPKYLFKHLNELEGFKDKDTAIITDIDGTISEIAPTPDEAMISSNMRTELIKLKDKFKLVAVISGRSVLNAKNMVNVEGLLYVGNHGLEYLKNGEMSMVPGAVEYLDLIPELEKELKKGELSKIKGLIFEDKGICLSVHYRGCENPEDVHEIILKTLQDVPQSKKFKVSEGRKIVECKPPIGYDKGVILEDIIQKYHLEKLIYLGDDITDADAFGKLKEMESKEKIRGAGVLVLSSEIPSYVKNDPSFSVNGVDDVLKFFRWLSN
ncbi:MAG: trehalose-phosphatase [Methanobacterium sp.]|nr:trehalose-phosphatase [Methanobacterium sp.]